MTLGFLIGDTTGDASVNSSDVGQTKSHSGTATTSSNFRSDVTVNDVIDSSDVSLVKSRSGNDLAVTSHVTRKPRPESVR